MDRLMRRVIHLPARAVLLIALSSVSTSAQEIAVGQWISVKAGPTAVLLYPSATSVDVGTVPAGIKLQVQEIRNGWYLVTLPRDPNERAARWGWLPAAAVEPSTAPTPSPGAPAPAGDALTALPTPRPVRARDQPTVAQRPPAAPDWRHRIFIGANGGAAQPGSVSFTDTRVDPFLEEEASWTAGYEVKRGSSLDVGAGVRVWRNLIASVDVSRFETRSPAELTGTVPHPFFFDQPRNITGESQRLEYTERAVHVSAAWILPAPRWIQLTVFGGPTVFSITRDLVEDIEYSDIYPYDAATFTGARIRNVRLTKTGFHAGGDVAWFFTDKIGVGAVVRFARAQANLTSPANQGPLAVVLGGLQAGGGVRVRLGRRR